MKHFSMLRASTAALLLVGAAVADEHNHLVRAVVVASMFFLCFLFPPLIALIVYCRLSYRSSFIGLVCFAGDGTLSTTWQRLRTSAILLHRVRCTLFSSANKYSHVAPPFSVPTSTVQTKGSGGSLDEHSGTISQPETFSFFLHCKCSRDVTFIHK